MHLYLGKSKLITALFHNNISRASTENYVAFDCPFKYKRVINNLTLRVYVLPMTEFRSCLISTAIIFK